MGQGAREYAKRKGMIGLLGELSHAEEEGVKVEKRRILGQCQRCATMSTLGPEGKKGRNGTIQETWGAREGVNERMLE